MAIHCISLPLTEKSTNSTYYITHRCWATWFSGRKLCKAFYQIKNWKSLHWMKQNHEWQASSQHLTISLLTSRQVWFSNFEILIDLKEMLSSGTCMHSLSRNNFHFHSISTEREEEAVCTKSTGRKWRRRRRRRESETDKCQNQESSRLMMILSSTQQPRMHSLSSLYSLLPVISICFNLTKLNWVHSSRRERDRQQGMNIIIASQ